MAQKQIPLPTGYDDDFMNIFKEVITMMNQMGYTYEESLQKAKEILEEARQTNDMNKSVQEQIDTLIAESGTSDAEVLQARIGADGNEYNVLKERLDAKDEKVRLQLAQNAINVKDFGAKGDEMTDDTDAIQSAIDYAISSSFKKVYLPAGKYRVSDTLTLDSGIEFYGAGMFSTTLYPDYKGENVFQNILLINGEENNRKYGVTLHDFGIDGSKAEFHDAHGEGNVNIGQWSRITPQFVDKFKAYNIYNYHGSHTFQMTGCRDFFINNIIVDYTFSIVHLTSTAGQNERGHISNIIGNSINCIVDFGAGGKDIIVDGFYGNNAGYITNKEESFDVGGAKNVKIMNGTSENFLQGVTLKGERGNIWEDVHFINITFKGYKRRGLRGIPGDTEGLYGPVYIKDCHFSSSEMTETDDFAIEFMHGTPNINISNTTVRSNQNGVRFREVGDVTIRGLDIDAEQGTALVSDDLAIAPNGKFNIADINVRGKIRGIDLNRAQGVILENFYITGVDNSYALYLSAIDNIMLRNGVIEDTNGHAIRLYFRENNVKQLNALNGLSAELSNITIRDWGHGSEFRSAINFVVPDVTGTFKGLRLSNLKFEITGNKNAQTGIDWSGFPESSKIDESIFDNIVFYRVTNPQMVEARKGDNIIENNFLVIDE